MKLGTRGSALATTQAKHIGARLQENGAEIEIVTVKTEGDRSQRPLTEIGGTGVFATALREALLRREIDIAVHSLKDLPVAAYPGLKIAAITTREDARDVVITSNGQLLTALEASAKVGTGSPRRAGQLATLAPSVQVVDIRGNVNTRISKVRSGQLDAVVLAAAGLKRLGRSEEITHTLSFEEMLPAPGQGALAVECRDPGDVAPANASEQERDDLIRIACSALDDSVTRACVEAERSMLAALEAGCTAPVGALATPVADGYELTGWVSSSGVSPRISAIGPDPDELGHHVAQELLRVIAAHGPEQMMNLECES
ncbi:MAG: hydroxymethylbilane synthase [Ornithinimicrobium sp.]